MLKLLNNEDRTYLRGQIEKAGQLIGTALTSCNDQDDHAAGEWLLAAKPRIQAALTLINGKDPGQRTKKPSPALLKSDEYDLLDQVIAKLPNSYLRDILTEEKGAIHRAIADDLAYLGLDEQHRQQQAQQRQADDQLRQVRQQITQAEQTVKTLQRQAQDAKDSIIESQRIAQRIVNIRL